MMANFHVVLIEPEIPANTGAITRLCAATGSSLHLVGRLGFRLDDRRLKRAGLDYSPLVEVQTHVDWPSCQEVLPAAPVYFFSARAERLYTEASYLPESILVFGCETRGLPPSLLRQTERCWRIPILDERVRSLNLATSVGIALYEGLRQCT
ncbi:tRNA (cytidine(34)-2'-O)-methyltransferase [Planctomycetes bacterium Pan216]|uniref:Putative tRNA (cytidine(34)-2'-O)-methyltransferase n=1 Tax=Kolteria novifilia TaxID=2527975 RepID=A0A518B868_9BACT|nr:tRNA (cytidine(34)-2'-O)-methyltransferase [Planctomycetes bacterium Pan216]